VRFWDVSSAGIQLLYKLTTADMFGGYYRGDMSDIDADEEWPPFRKVNRHFILPLVCCLLSETFCKALTITSCLWLLIPS